MSTPFSHPGLAAKLHAHLVKQCARGTTDWENNAKSYLMGKQSWSDTWVVLSDCFDPDTADGSMLNSQLCTRLEESTTNLENLLAPILMVWGWSQPWVDSFNTQKFVMTWAENNVRVAPSACQKALWAINAFLGNLVELGDVPKPVDALAWVLTNVFTLPNNWAPNNYQGRFPDRYMQCFDKCLVPLGQLIEQVPEVNKKNKLFAQWSSYAQQLMKTNTKGGTSPYSLQRYLAQDVLQSPLPKKYKVTALKEASAFIWVENAATLAPLLPSNEVATFKRLPWQTLVRLSEKQACVDTNSELVRLYCPALHPLLELGVSNDDWCKKERIAEWLNKFAQQNPVDELALPNDALAM